jgi:hypothetical protein
MMCLGKNWDPNSRSYGDTRPFDGAQPPSIPEVFSKIVKDAIQASNEFLRQKARPANDVEELPPLSPDICLVNFYTSSGKLGLHQVRKIHNLQRYTIIFQRLVLQVFLNKLLQQNPHLGQSSFSYGYFLQSFLYLHLYSIMPSIPLLFN